MQLPSDNLIFDRAQSDISAKTPKGYFNAAELTRIEQWTQYLSGLLSSYGYSAPVTTRGWTMADYPTRGEIDRIRANIDALQTGFYALPDWREIVYNNTLGFEQANALEFDLQRIYDWLSAMASWANMRQSGTIFMQAGGIFNAR